MAKSFNIVAELQLQGPKNLNQITRQIAKSLKGVSVDVNLKIPKTVAAQLNQINKSLQSLNAVASQANQKAAQLSSGLQKVQKASAAAASANKKAGSAIGSTSKQLKEATSAAESTAASRTYNRKASEPHLPSSCIAQTSIPARARP